MSSSPLLFSSDDDDEKIHGKPNLSPPTKSSSSSSDSEPKTPRRSSGMKKSRDSSRADTRVRPKQSRDRPEAKLPVSKKKKSSRKTGASGSESQIDIEELLAQTYSKEPSVLGDATRRWKGPGKPSEPAKDWAKKWSAEVEMNLANALLASSAGGQINMTAFYERAREFFPSDSRSQLYEKMRRMRSRFWTIESQLRDAKVAEDLFPYRSRHEGDLYKVWKCIWGHHERTEAAQDMEMEQNRELRSRSHAKQVDNGDTNDHESRIEAAQNKEMEQNRESYAHALQAHNVEVNEKPPEEEEEEHWQAEEEEEYGQTAGKAATRTAWNHDGEFNLIQKEIKALVCEVQTNVQTMLDDTPAKMEGLVDNLLKRASAAAQVQSLRSEIGIGTCVCSSLSWRMKELQGVWSVREFSGLDEAGARQLKQKWRKHQMEELRIFSVRLALLKEECKLCIKDLEITNSNHKS